jgi:hypothetical protein
LKSGFCIAKISSPGQGRGEAEKELAIEHVIVIALGTQLPLAVCGVEKATEALNLEIQLQTELNQDATCLSYGIEARKKHCDLEKVVCTPEMR